MTRTLAFAALLTLAACHHQATDVSRDADGDARNTTAAKTTADLAAADDASRGPAPVVAPPPAARTDTQSAPATDANDQAADTAANVQDAAPASSYFNAD